MLIENKEQYRANLSSIGDAVLSMDAFGIVTFVNEVACSLIGLSESSTIGKRVSEVMEIFSEDSDEPAIIPVEHVLETGKRLDWQIILRSDQRTENLLNCRFCSSDI